MMNRFPVKLNPTNQPYAGNAACGGCPLNPQCDGQPRCMLLYPMPDAFAFWLWVDGHAAQDAPPWLIPGGFRLHCHMQPQVLPQQAVTAPGEAMQACADRCPCPAMAGGGLGVCMASLEVSAAYFNRKAGVRCGTETPLPDEDSIRRMTLCRRGEVFQVFHDVVQYRGTGVAAALFYEAKVCEVIAYLLEALAAQQPNQTPDNCLCGEDRRGLAKAAGHLNTHLQEEFSLDTLCQIACMGKTKLKKAFRDAYQCTLTDFHKQQRVQEAKRLLRETDLPIAAVARATGYLAGGRFAILFRQMTGYLPSEYRRFFR